jgi:hypothetical protein
MDKSKLSKEYRNLLSILEQIGFTFEYDSYEQICMLHSSNFGIYIIPPHDSIERWLVRAEHMEEFDKWGRAYYQGYLPILSDSYIKDLIEDLNKFIKLKNDYLKDDDFHIDFILSK